MNRSYSKIRHIQQSNLMLETKRVVEKNRLFLIEEDEKSINNQLINNYVNAVRNAFPEYANTEGFKDSSTTGTATIFGKEFYITPLTLPKEKSRVLSNLQKIQGSVIGKNEKGKELQSTCIPKINNANYEFKDSFCVSFNSNNANFGKYAAMNTAYDNLYNNINNIGNVQ